MINKLKTICKGFTLIETLLAVLLLSTAIAGPLTIASKGLTSAVVAKDQIGAFYLAQDAMEYLRYKRDSNCLAAGATPNACPASTWLSGLGTWSGSAWSGTCTSSDGSQTCQVDSIQDTATACTGACAPLTYNSSLGYFGYAVTSGWVQTPQRYVRTVKITTPFGGNNGEAKIEITVTWTTGSLSHTITMRENLLNWQ